MEREAMLPTWRWAVTDADKSRGSAALSASMQRAAKKKWNSHRIKTLYDARAGRLAAFHLRQP